MTKITNLLTAGLVAFGGILTIKDVMPILGLLAIILAILVNIVSLWNKKSEKNKIKHETTTTMLEQELLRKKIANLTKSKKDA